MFELSFRIFIFSLFFLGQAAVAELAPCDPSLEFDKKSRPVVSPHVGKIPYECIREGEKYIKTFRITAEEVFRDFLSTSDKEVAGMEPGPIYTWGYNGSTSGPTIEAIEGEWVRFIVKNKLPDPTTIHWHGIILPNDQDGGGAHTQKLIEPGKTHVYEFQLNQYGTYMYHSGHDIAKQHAMGLGGFFVIHPKRAEVEVDHDVTFFLNMWTIEPHSQIPDTMSMMFNFFTMNGKSGPAISSIHVKSGDKVRVRFANLSMMEHPIHLHGHHFKIVSRGVGRGNPNLEQDTVGVKTGQPIEIEFEATKHPGTWLFHCHLPHHVTNNMEIDPVPGEPMQHEGAGMFTSIQVDKDDDEDGESGEDEYDPHARHRAGAPVVGRYTGFLEFDSGKRLLAQMDIYKAQFENEWRRFQSDLKIFLGGFDSPEYIYEEYHKMDYSFESGAISIENAGKAFLLQDIEVFKSEDDVRLEGLACSGYTGECANVYFQLNGAAEPMLDEHEIDDFVFPLAGEYHGVCEGKRVALQIETHRGLNGENLPNVNPMGAYRITGRMAEFENEEALVSQSYDSGDFDFVSGNLTLSGALGFLVCRVENRQLICKNPDCQLSRNNVPDFLSLEVPRYEVAVPQIAVVDESPKVTEFTKSRNVEGVFSGYIYHERLGLYQAMSLDVKYRKYSSRPMQLERPFVSVVAKLFFDEEKREKLTFRFLKRPFLDSSSKESTGEKNTMALEDERGNTFIVTEWRQKSIRGVWISSTYGRVGPAVLSRGAEFPNLPPGNRIIPSVNGLFKRSVKGIVKTFRIQSVGVSEADEGSANPYYPLRLRGRRTMSYENGGRVLSASEVTGGTYDFYSGFISLSFHPNGGEEAWIGGRVTEVGFDLFDPGRGGFRMRLQNYKYLPYRRH